MTCLKAKCDVVMRLCHCTAPFEVLFFIVPDELQHVWPFRKSHPVQASGGDSFVGQIPGRPGTKAQICDSLSLSVAVCLEAREVLTRMLQCCRELQMVRPFRLVFHLSVHTGSCA